jgi:hypothetical protein
MVGLAVQQTRRRPRLVTTVVAAVGLFLGLPPCAACAQDSSTTPPAPAAPTATVAPKKPDQAAAPSPAASDTVAPTGAGNQATQEPRVVPPPPESATTPASGDTKPTPPKDKAELEARLAKWKAVDWKTLAEKDQLRFVQQVRQKCEETILDITATFFKQERIKGKLGKEEACLMKCRTTPFAVYMKYTKGDKDREALYVEGQYDNKIQAHPGGAMGPLFQVQIKPDSDLAMKDNLRPITMAGMVNMLRTVVPQFELASANGDLKTEYLGQMDIGGRKAYAVKRILPQKPIYPCLELVLFIDAEELVPVGADSYDWDGQLQSTYRYTEFKINPGLTDYDFDKKNKAYNF